MINTPELKSRMVLNGDRQEDLAVALNMSTSTLNMKINNKTPFSQPEIEAIVLRYSLSAEDIQRIFFAKTCHCE